MTIEQQDELLNAAKQLQRSLQDHLIYLRRTSQITRKMYSQAFEATLTAFDDDDSAVVYNAMVAQAAKHGMQVRA